MGLFRPGQIKCLMSIGHSWAYKISDFLGAYILPYKKEKNTCKFSNRQNNENVTVNF